jgi:anti-anti-sigma factor
MNYQIQERDGLLLMRISGDTRNNEALRAKRSFLPYLGKKGVRVVIDLEEVGSFEPVVLLGVLNSIRKEVGVLRGDLTLRSLKPELLSYLKANRLDRIFRLYEHGEESAGRRSGSYEEG